MTHNRIFVPFFIDFGPRSWKRNLPLQLCCSSLSSPPTLRCCSFFVMNRVVLTLIQRKLVPFRSGWQHALGKRSADTTTTCGWLDGRTSTSSCFICSGDDSLRADGSCSQWTGICHPRGATYCQVADKAKEFVWRLFINTGNLICIEIITINTCSWQDWSSGEGCVMAIVHWIFACNGSKCSFSLFQDTIVALQSLASYATLVYGDSINLNVQVNGRGFEKRYSVASHNNLLLQKDEVPVPNRLMVSTSGIGCALVQVRFPLFCWPVSKNVQEIVSNVLSTHFPAFVFCRQMSSTTSQQTPQRDKRLSWGAESIQSTATAWRDPSTSVSGNHDAWLQWHKEKQNLPWPFKK